MIDLLVTFHAAAHLSHFLFNSYPNYGTLDVRYKVLRFSDILTHFMVFYTQIDYLHLAMFISHVLKLMFPRIGRSMYLNAIDTFSYISTSFLIQSYTGFMLGFSLYVLLKINRQVW